VALLIGFWPLRLLRFYGGFALLYCGWIVLYLYAACSAQLARDFPTNVRSSKWWLAAILPITILTLNLLGQAVTRASGFRSFTVPSTSMERTVLQGDHLVADMRYYRSRRPNRRDIIVFLKDSTFFVKRVIAVGGDSIEGSNGVIFLLGEVEDEPYVEHTGTQGPDWLKNFGPVVIPNGKCFVMGDNRDVSLDSRSVAFGLIDDSSIVGKPLYIFGSHRAGRSIR
jgi:signal peptidase I